MRFLKMLHKQKRRKSLLMETVEEMDRKLGTLIGQVSQLTAARPAFAEKPADTLEPGIEAFTEFEPFSTEE